MNIGHGRVLPVLGNSLLKGLVLCLSSLLVSCYGWEYPRLEHIQKVEGEQSPVKVAFSDIIGPKGEKYIGGVIEIEGKVLHIVNKGGAPAITLGDIHGDFGILLVFGPNQREPIKRLRVGDIYTFKGILVDVPKFRHHGMLKPAVVLP